MVRLRWLLATVVTAGTLTLGCGGGAGGPSAKAAGSPVDRFNADRAWSTVERQLAYGQRPAGSPQLRAAGAEAAPAASARPSRAAAGRAGAAERGRHAARPPAGRRDRRALRHAGQAPGFVGANNGAAGSAVVIEAARALRRAAGPRRPRGALRAVRRRGAGRRSARGERDFYSAGLRGSRAYVARHPRRTGAMVLLDYVGNRGLRLPREGSSRRPCGPSCAPPPHGRRGPVLPRRDRHDDRRRPHPVPAVGRARGRSDRLELSWPLARRRPRQAVPRRASTRSARPSWSSCRSSGGQRDSRTRGHGLGRPERARHRPHEADGRQVLRLRSRQHDGVEGRLGSVKRHEAHPRRHVALRG